MGAVFVVMPKLENGKKIQSVLFRHGFSQAFVFTTAAAALQSINTFSQGVVVSACQLPDMHYLEFKDCLPKHFEMILIGTAAAIAAADASILSVTVPLAVRDFISTVEMVSRQVERRHKKEKKSGKRTEQEENYIRNAKMLLMERNRLSEAEAFRYIQKCSMDNSTSMVETAQMILALDCYADEF